MPSVLRLLSGPGVQSAAPLVPAGYGRLPLAFEPNMGQTDPKVLFLTRSRGTTVFFTGTEAVMLLDAAGRRQPAAGRRRGPSGAAEQAVMRMTLVGAGKPLHAAGLEKLPGISNYLIGNDPKKWRTDIPNYARVRFQDVYPGVDLVCYGQGGQLEYDLLVMPGADPRRIELAWDGVDRLERNSDGDLVLRTPAGAVVQKRPLVYQEAGGRRVRVAASYEVRAGNHVTMALAHYDRSRPLVIDPVVLIYSTFLGGTGDDGATSVAVDSAGSAYVTGWTYSADFPTQSPYQGINRGQRDVFVSKLSTAGSALVYSTYLGGSGDDWPEEIAVDSTFHAYFAGFTTSSDFPTQSAFQSTAKSGQQAFVTKLSPAGTALVYSTYLGGSGQDGANSIVADAAGYAYVVGDTASAAAARSNGDVLNSGWQAVGSRTVQ